MAGMTMFKIGTEMLRAAVQNQNPDNGMAEDARWKLVERVVATPGFSKSPRLSSLLQHVVRQTLHGRDGELTEQLIGERIFGRPVGYDSRDDNIVRAHASRLRHRLDAYFGEQGKEEPLRVVIPRGSYVPYFERVSPASPAPHPIAITADRRAEEAAEPFQEKARWGARWIRLAASFACLASLLLAGPVMRTGWGAILARTAGPRHTLWSAIFSGNRETLIVPADSSLIILKSFTRRPVSIADYASGKYLSDVNCDRPCDPVLITTLAQHRYTSLADLQFAVALSHLPEAVPSRMEIRYARDLQLDDLKRANLILIGSLEADPWLQFFRRQMNFVLQDDHAKGPLQVDNRRPAAGEPSIYSYDVNDPTHRGYALVAYLSNLSGTGNVLVVQGFTLAGTEAAAEFVTDDHNFDSLFGPIIAKRHGLPHFEVLLRTMDVNGLGARPSVVSDRIY